MARVRAASRLGVRCLEGHIDGMARDFVMHKPKGTRIAARPVAKATSQSPRIRRDFAAPLQGAKPVEEIGGPSGPEPTRYGDWERKGICYDF